MAWCATPGLDWVYHSHAGVAANCGVVQVHTARAPFRLSTSPFRKLRVLAESEYGLQNFTEPGYGLRIYGIEMDMYGISRGIIFCFFWKSHIRHLRIPRIHGFRADSAKNGAPLSHA
jgi:hypothetical protein